ncbi:MAG: SMC family ATPase [Desulfobulbaceae bacterium]
MNILSVTLRNIKSHRCRELSFVPGINVLSGPNGAGKSTVFEAIGYALFGVNASEFVTNIERFLTIGEKRGEVAVTFRTDDGEVFRVSRGVGAGSKWLLAREAGGGFEVEEHAGTAETEERIGKLLGLDNGRSLADQFKLVIGPFQNDFLGPFVIRQPARRQDAFDEILGIDAWRRTFRNTSRLPTLLEGKINTLDAGIREKKEQVAELPERREELRTVTKTLAGRRKLLADTEKKLTALESRVAALDRQKETLDRLRAEEEKTKTAIGSGREHIARQELLVRQAEEAATLVEKNRPGKEAYEEADKLLHSLREREKVRRTLEKELARLEREQVRLTESIALAEKEIARTREELAGEEQGLAEERKTVEPTAKLVTTAKRLEEVEKELTGARTRRGQLEGARENLEEGRDKLGEGVCPFFSEPCRNLAGREPKDVFSGRLEQLARDLETVTADIRRLEQEREACMQARADIDRLRERARGLDDRAAALGERKKKNDLRVRELEKPRAALKKIEEELARKKKELAPYAGLDEEISRAQAEKKKNLKARDEFTRHQQAAGALADHRATLEKYRVRLREHEANLDTIHNKIKVLAGDYDPKAHEQARGEKEELLGAVARTREQIDNMERERERLEQRVARLREVRREIETLRATRKQLVRRLEMVDFLRNQVFKNVSAQLSERFREEISLRADRIYRTISEADEELVWGERYRIVLRDMVDGVVRERSDDQLSGGQVMSAVVALRLALLQTIGARIAFFDEPTSNLDAARRENLARAFRAIDIGREEVTEHWYDQLFLISHDVAFTEITDQVIELGMPARHP